MIYVIQKTDFNIGRHTGTTDEIAGMALYLASEAGAFATGQSFVVDGGFTL